MHGSILTAKRREERRVTSGPLEGQLQLSLMRLFVTAGSPKGGRPTHDGTQNLHHKTRTYRGTTFLAASLEIGTPGKQYAIIPDFDHCSLGRRLGS